MGPRLCGRGDTTPDEGPQAPLELQWGRAFVGAEMPLHLAPRDILGRFNGAAPLWARRSGSLGSGAFVSSGLQWGRAFVGAEMPQHLRTQHGRPQASMGPRLCGRGDAIWSSRPGARMPALQWGRAFVGAEMTDRDARQEAVHFRFNGAAPLWARRWR